MSHSWAGTILDWNPSLSDSKATNSTASGTALIHGAEEPNELSFFSAENKSFYFGVGFGLPSCVWMENPDFQGNWGPSFFFIASILLWQNKKPPEKLERMTQWILLCLSHRFCVSTFCYIHFFVSPFLPPYFLAAFRSKLWTSSHFSVYIVN